MDLLDFDGGQVYFDEPLCSEARVAIDTAADLYGEPAAEHSLLRAYFLEPRHPLVLVALYRYYYYQYRYDDALRVVERVILLFAGRLGFPEDWRQLDRARFENGVLVSMTMVRFYMLALKGAGYLESRLGDRDAAQHRLQKVVDLDEKDRLGARALLQVVRGSAGDDEHDQALPA